MFEKFLRFFVENSKMNYTLFVLIFIAGIWSYQKMPKEVFPSFELEMISINGHYTGTSVDILDKMAVKTIEDNVKSLSGVVNISTVINPSKFIVIVEFEKGINRYDMLNKVKDSVSSTLSNLPKDMDEPTVNLQDRSKELVTLALTSKTKTTDELKTFADDFKSKLYSIRGISEVTIFGDSDKFYEIIFDEKKLEAYNINQSEFFEKLTTLSYIFPIGQIEDTQKHYYLSTNNGAKTENDLKNTLLKFQNTTIYLKDVASIKKKYEDATTLYSYNGETTLSLAIKQNETANALEISKEIKNLIAKLETKEITINTTDDNSVRIIDRLNVVSSDIAFGIILIAILVTLLINARISFVIIMGIPTSFVIAMICMNYLGYSINIISLIGILLAIGIVVDDAIIVSENIQQHIENGMSPHEASISGAKEMFEPVLIASISIICAFLPMLMLSGQMGEMMKPIPIALSILVFASFVETFLFLPIHAAHTLKANTKTTSWEKANKIYNHIIHFLMRWRKTFVIFFIIIIPLLTFFMIKSSKFQMFPEFDVNNLKISIKANENSTLEETFTTLKKLEKELLARKDEFHIKSIDSIAGYRKDVARNTERNSYVMYMSIDLTDIKPSNFMDTYINPALSFYETNTIPTRTLSSIQISKNLTEFIKTSKMKERYALSEITILEQKAGPIKSDIQIGFISNNLKLTEESIKKLENKLMSTEGVHSLQNSIKYGNDEIKLEVNDYGKSLGLSESYIGSYLSNLYGIKTKATSFDEIQMIDIKIKSINKDDFETFKNTKIPLEPIDKYHCLMYVSSTIINL